MKSVKGCLGLIGLAVVVLVIIAVVASLGGKGTTHTAGSSSTPKPSSKPSKPSKPTNVLDSHTGTANRVNEGGAYTLGDFKIHRGWKIEKIGYGAGWNVKNLQVENISDSDHTFAVNIKLHKGPHVIVANMPCLADTAHPKDVVNVDCVPDGHEKPYGYITIENTF